MRDTLFRYRADDLRMHQANIVSPSDTITQKIGTALGGVGINETFEVRFMGEFSTMHACVEYVTRTLATNALACLVTGSLNYLKSDQWSESKDVDACIFVRTGNYTSFLYEYKDGDKDVDLSITSVRFYEDDKDDNVARATVLRILLPLYHVSRIFFNVRASNSYDRIITAIRNLKEKCRALGVKSGILPAFKGFVIAIVAIEGNSDLTEDMKTLSNLNSITITSNDSKESFDVTVTPYPDGTNVADMGPHIVNIDVSGVGRRTKRLGNVALRRGITYLLRAHEFATNKLVPPASWLTCTLDLPIGKTSAQMRSVVTHLETDHNDHVVFVTIGQDHKTLDIRVMNDPKAPGNDFSVTTPATPATPSICFWKFTQEDTREGTPYDASHPLVTVGGIAASNEEQAFLFAMIHRSNDKLPLVSRSVDDETRWSGLGLCHCHSNNVLPEKFIYNHPTGVWHLSLNNEAAYEKHMQSWFESGLKEHFTRFSYLIKHLDDQRRDGKEMPFVTFDVDNDMLNFSEDIVETRKRSLGPSVKGGNISWSKNDLSTGWKQLRMALGSQPTPSQLAPSTPPPSERPLMAPGAPRSIKTQARLPTPSLYEE